VTVPKAALPAVSMVAKRLVVVALVEVELRAVKSWSVEEPVARRFMKVPWPFTSSIELAVLLPIEILPLSSILKSAVEEPIYNGIFPAWALTSSWARDEVAFEPIKTWFVVVARRRPLPLTKSQSVSLPPPPPSVPQEKTPSAHSSLSAEPLQVVRLAPKSFPLM
jgi:hypothetical protein